ncbi:hypothetical protein HXX76_004119 [Chlamydomonas incerta]|uniref:Uncharacterized protein n=1 Tax=Chlamydomonas incerta TaxID=51695 RepID=A0A835T6U5_CHLIN|nr:hypothetical protein HXX76_004119 [Chlamydomonas incerta]|eukprot:KAG2440002.1 hypothetical protein HXX76_004119 [Chlamydomonas incerta]
MPHGASVSPVAAATPPPLVQQLCSQPAVFAQVGPEEYLLCAARSMQLDLDATARLALHIWRRCSGMVTILQSIRPPRVTSLGCELGASGAPQTTAAAPAYDSSMPQQLVPTPPARRSSTGLSNGPGLACAPSLPRACATACLWLAVKLEEDRRTAPPVRVLAAVSRTSAAELADLELRILHWLEWAPCRGYVP